VRAAATEPPPAHGTGEPDVAALLAEVRRIDAQTRRLVAGVMAGGWHSVFRGAGLEFQEVREYVEGDDPRTVDWNVTARMGRPFVKKHVEEREGTVVFLLDVSASMSAGLGAWSARGAAARTIACLALSATRNDDRVGLVAFADDVVARVEARRGLPHALRVLRDALALPAVAGEADPARALDLVARTERRHSVVFLVSDFLSEGWARAARRCARRHDLVAVRVLPPETRGLPPALLRARDPETGHESLLDGRSPRARAAYAERVARWRRRTEEDLRLAGVDRIDVEVPEAPRPDAVAGPIVRFFRMRERRGARR
jgi:uncharacterized protein (DUF58 family)